MRLAIVAGFLLLAGAPRAPGGELLAVHFPGMRLVQRVDAAILRDGSDDVAVVYAGEDGSRVAVARFESRPRESDPSVIDAIELPSSPFGPPTVSVRNHVLIIEHLTGGTTATQTTYRFRLDPEQDCMGLIGLDTERYSRTGAHGGLRVSWNLLTGRFVSQHVPAQGSTAKPSPERVTRRPPGPVCMALIDTPDEVLDAVVAAESRRR